MSKNEKKVIKNSEIFELLTDNSPKVYPDYKKEAAILEQQINTKNVNNIAIVAKYGAGKSSLIATYLEYYRNKKSLKQKLRHNTNISDSSKVNKYVKVSLSTFNDNDYKESEIEQSVLQQLLYSRKKEKFPNSEIARTNRTPVWRPICFALLIVIFICSAILFGLDGASIKLINEGWAIYLYASLFVVSLFFLLFVGIRYHKLKKINYKDLEVEFNKKDEKSSDNNLINKFTNEILYFFECVDVDLVIFEDLDRLKTTEIFVKLREINTVINNSRKRFGKVTFLYAVKDDLFKTEEERAKFFEFILPITPVINPMTTKVEIEERVKRLVKINEKMKLSTKFIKGISLYIPDMRILNNVFNDYIIMYYKIMEDEKASPYLENNKLFALCVYKNLFPHDYAMLEKNSGLIPSIINLDKLRIKYAKSLEEEKVAINSRIEKVKHESLNNFEELKAVFIAQIAKRNPGNYGNGNAIDPKSITTFEALDFTNILHPIYRDNLIQMKPYEKEIVDANGIKFIDRERQIKDKESNQINELKIKLSELDIELQQIANYTMDYIVKISDEEFYLDDEVVAFYETDYNKIIGNSKNKNMDKLEEQVSYLKFLLKNNYIDEYYIEYTSSYQSDIISIADIQVAKNIQIKKIDFNAKIVDVIGLVKWLDDEDFRKESVIIKQILLKIEEIRKLSKEENDNKFNNLIMLLSDKSQTNVLDLLNNYFETTDVADFKSLLKYLLPHRPSLVVELVVLGRLEKNIIDNILVNSINFAQDYNLIDVNEILQKYISENKDYLTIFGAVNDIEKVKAFLDIIKPKFNIMQDIDNANLIQNYIIENNYYRISLSNLKEICISKFGISAEDFSSKNYTLIKELKVDYLNSYIEANINQYVQEILLQEDISLKNENQEYIISLLKNEILDIEFRKALIEKINFKFDNLENLNVELLPTIFEFNKITATWDNIHYAYNKKGFDCICSFIKNANNIEGDFCKVGSVDEEKTINLLNTLLNVLDVNSITKISNFIKNTYDLKQLNVKEIPDDNLAIFIGCGKISYSNLIFANLVEKELSLEVFIKLYTNNILKDFDKFLCNNIYEIIRDRVYINYGYQTRERKNPKQNAQMNIARVLKLKNIDINIKKQLIDCCKDFISIKDFETIYKDYIINEGQTIPSNILWQFIDTKGIISDNDRKNILTICFKEIDVAKDKDKLQSYLNSLDASWNIFNYNKSEIRVNNTIENKNLLNVLEQNNLITMRKSNKKGKNELIVKSKVDIA